LFEGTKVGTPVGGTKLCCTPVGGAKIGADVGGVKVGGAKLGANVGGANVRGAKVGVTEVGKIFCAFVGFNPLIPKFILCSLSLHK
jgi:hypothetical protein